MRCAEMTDIPIEPRPEDDRQVSVTFVINLLKKKRDDYTPGVMGDKNKAPYTVWNLLNEIMEEIDKEK